MGARGRKSAAEMAVVSPGLDRRIAPPASLTPAEKSVWVSVVNSRPADWFEDAHIGILAQYCRHKVQSDVVAAQIEGFDPQWLEDEGGLERYERLLKMQSRETTSMNQLMRAMRLTQQSLIRAEKVVKPRRSKKPWESD